MSAGVTRIIEICFIATKISPEGQDEDVHSEHTLSETPRQPAAFVSGNTKMALSAFQYLPPFVRLQKPHYLTPACLLSDWLGQLLVAAG